MLRSLFIFACLLPFLTASPCLAEGGVQLSLEGTSGPHGALMELNVTAFDTKSSDLRTVQVDLSLYVAAGTPSSDVLATLNDRIRAAAITTVLPTTEKRLASLFVSDATRVRSRVGGDFELTITTSEGPPTWIRLERPARLESVSTLRIAAVGRSSIDGRTGTDKLTLELDAKANGPSVSNSLHKHAGALGWLSDRPELSSWRPLRVGDGLLVVGCSVSVSSADPWWLDIGL